MLRCKRRLKSRHHFTPTSSAGGIPSHTEPPAGASVGARNPGGKQMRHAVAMALLACSLQATLCSAAPSEQPAQPPGRDTPQDCRPDYGALNMDPDLCVPDHQSQV